VRHVHKWCVPFINGHRRRTFDSVEAFISYQMGTILYVLHEYINV
jgi:hypothetical protein